MRLRRSWLVNGKLQTPLESVWLPYQKIVLPSRSSTYTRRFAIGASVESVSVPERVTFWPYLIVLVVVGLVTTRLVASGLSAAGVNAARAVASASALGEPSPVAGS